MPDVLGGRPPVVPAAKPQMPANAEVPRLGDQAPPPVVIPPTPVIGPTDTPMVSNQPAGVLVQAVVAPATGSIPASSGHAVVVAVKDWFESSTIWISIVSFGGIALNTLIENVIPLIESNQPIQWKPIGTKVLLAVMFAYIGIRRGTDNSAIRSLPLVSTAK